MSGELEGGMLVLNIGSLRDLAVMTERDETRIAFDVKPLAAQEIAKRWNAFPDLLAAAKAAMPWLESAAVCEKFEDNRDPGESHETGCDACRLHAAIAKAGK